MIKNTLNSFGRMKKFIAIALISMSAGILSLKKETTRSEVVAPINPMSFNIKRDLGNAD